MAKERKIVDSTGFTFHFVVETILLEFIFSFIFSFISVALESAGLNNIMSLVINVITFVIFTYLIFYCSVIRVCGVKQLDRNYLGQTIRNITIYIIIFTLIQVIGGYSSGIESLNEDIVYMLHPSLRESMKAELMTQMIPLLAIKGIISLSLIPLVKKWLLPRV